ncbi:ChaN family lipoprotein [Pseudoalteromonas sp. SWN166]|uniref:ChaN family lipoprotein n=1 Tax=Pseudoalteromonas sp. SWN166 TaxID=2792061 RepID=UPI0018CD4756|nr:ChaN family lipoprotein [Pseudoalteromonas sp. SWN166]MBH0039310.1 ChaN family lipoprotein [Pseudoalteromonas sp. SWN166]
MKKSMLTLALVTGLSGCSTTTVPPDKSSSLYYSALYNAQAKPVSSVLLEPSLLNADVVLVGEWHTHPGVHLFQAELFEQLSVGNKRTALSLEQFSRADQHILNQFVKGEIGEQYLIDNTQAWPNYKSDYRALVELAKTNNSDVIAANAPKNIVTCVGRQGISYLNKLDETQQSYIASTIDTSPSEYKQRFMASMHHGSPSQNENYFSAQVAWDETMGESIVNYITAHKNTQVMHIAGDFHVKNGEGIARVIKRLAPELNVVWISPVTNVQANQTGYQLQVNPLPPRYIQKEHQQAAFKALGKRGDRGEQTACL